MTNLLTRIFIGKNKNPHDPKVRSKYANLGGITGIIVNLFLFAGKLIMDAGLRGYSVGDAQVSEKHCGFVINKGNATATEIRTLMDDVTKKVKEEFGVQLEPEVILLGND